jgi:hypothetical protein
MALALDLCVPPLALLALLLAATWCASALFFELGQSQLPLDVATAAATLLLLAILMSWVRYARHVVSLMDLALAILYALWKIPLYAKFLVARQLSWVRSERDQDKRQ